MAYHFNESVTSDIVLKYQHVTSDIDIYDVTNALLGMYNKVYS